MDAEDVRREAAGTTSRRAGPRAIVRPPAAEAAADGDLAERVSVLEEVSRRYRMIDELRERIEACHVEISRHRCDIETLLQGPSQVLND